MTALKRIKNLLKTLPFSGFGGDKKILRRVLND